MSSEDKVKMFQDIVDEMTNIYVDKNHDYGDSVHDTYERYGMTSFLVRMEDKINRIKTLTEGEAIKVKDEKIEDTLKDLANYAILAIMEMRREKMKMVSSDDYNGSLCYVNRSSELTSVLGEITLY